MFIVFLFYNIVAFLYYILWYSLHLLYLKTTNIYSVHFKPSIHTCSFVFYIFFLKKINFLMFMKCFVSLILLYSLYTKKLFNFS